ncbi:MAG: phosphatidylglycerophosphatase A [Deltaproteobacteria bacterium]|nr:phosphatidylglycerophosphatase A [Deltaproteobacteria bacterium]
MNNNSKSQQWTFSETFIKAVIPHKIALLLASWFGSGMVPKFPGTIGTLTALPLLLVLHVLESPYEGIFIIAFILLAIWTADVCSRLLGQDDPGAVVIDEAAGLLVTLFLLPLSWLNITLAFFLFRFFDIFKPYPIRLIDQKIHGGWGIVLDDVLAGVYANVVIRLINAFIL